MEGRSAAPGRRPPGPGERLRSPPSQGAGTERSTVSFQTGNPRTLTRFDVRVGPQHIEARHVTPPRALSLNRQGGRRTDWADCVFRSDGGLRRWRLKATFHLYCFYISRPSPPNEKIKPLTRQLTSTFYEQTEVSFFPSTLHRGTEDSQGQNLGTGPQPTSVGGGAA